MQAAILLENATEVYYKIRQVFYYKMQRALQIATVQSVIWIASNITLPFYFLLQSTCTNPSF